VTGEAVGGDGGAGRRIRAGAWVRNEDKVREERKRRKKKGSGREKNNMKKEENIKGNIKEINKEGYYGYFILLSM
jgi:hypothetical protein